MASFKDKNGQPWEISLTFGDVLRVKKASEGKYDLLDATKELNQRLWVDLGDLYEVLWYLCEPQAKERGVTAEQFGSLLAAACIVDARSKFFEEWIDFFRGLQHEETAIVLERTVELHRMAAKTAAKKAREMLGEEFTERATAKVNEAILLAFGNWEASWDATLAHTPGDNWK